jgi:hypothetical protein
MRHDGIRLENAAEKAARTVRTDRDARVSIMQSVQ